MRRGEVRRGEVRGFMSVRRGVYTVLHIILHNDDMRRYPVPWPQSAE